MSRPKGPCKDCEERVAEPNCHSTCEKYLIFEAENEVYKEMLQKGREQDSLHHDLGKRRKKLGGTRRRK